MSNWLFFKWLDFGVKRKWITKPICNTHEGTYEYEDEDNRREWDEGGDPCAYVLLVIK